MSDTNELIALMDAAIDLLQQAVPGPAVNKLETQFVAWQRRHDPEIDVGTELEIASILSHRTKRGGIEVSLGREKVQMDLDKAREISGMFLGAIEAATSDEMLFKFLTARVGLTEAQAGAALLDFRELRQGSRDVVYPS